MSIVLQSTGGGQITINEPATASNFTQTLPAATGTVALLDGSNNLSVAGNLSFNSGYGSSAIAYGCRAWVNFNGTGTVAIRGSGNVSSITDNGTGDYTVNFTTAMPDANYGVSAWARASSGFFYFVSARSSDTKTTSALRIFVIRNGDGNTEDVSEVDVSIFR